MVVTVNLIIDILHGILNPKVRVVNDARLVMGHSV